MVPPRETEPAAEEREAGTSTSWVGRSEKIVAIRRLYMAGNTDAALRLADQVRARDAIPLNAVPVVKVTPAALMKLPLDHRAGFLLTRIDGTSSVREIIEVSSLDGADALAILERLVTLGAVGLVAHGVAGADEARCLA